MGTESDAIVAVSVVAPILRRLRRRIIGLIVSTTMDRRAPLSGGTLLIRSSVVHRNVYDRRVPDEAISEGLLALGDSTAAFQLRSSPSLRGDR
jgi:hypothetical protein